MIAIIYQAKKASKRKRLWQLPLIGRRNEDSLFYKLIQEMRGGSNPDYCHHQYFRMMPPTFDYILGKIEHRYVTFSIFFPAQNQLVINIHNLNRMVLHFHLLLFEELESKTPK